MKTRNWRLKTIVLERSCGRSGEMPLGWSEGVFEDDDVLQVLFEEEVVMRRIVMLAVCMGVLALLAGVASASTYTLYPTDLADGPTFQNGQGGVPFGYDPDMPPPIGVFVTGPTGYGDSCWWSDVQGSAAGGPTDYTSFRLSPKDISGISDFDLNDLTSLSYWSSLQTIGSLDWQIKIYTESATNWYGKRFNFTRGAATDSNWYEWNAGGGSGTELMVNDIYDKDASASLALPVAGSSLSHIQAVYGSEEILFIDIIASYMTASPPSDSYLDGVEMSYTGGAATMDLAAIPEPISLIFFGTGVVGVFGFVSRKRMRKSA